MQRWCHVLLSDESMFAFYRLDGCRRVFQCRSEWYTDNRMMECDIFGGGIVMVWGGIYSGCKNPLSHHWRLLDSSTVHWHYPVIDKFVCQLNLIFQENNIRWRDLWWTIFTKPCNVDTLLWPPHSPDLLQTEHVGVLVLNSRIWMRPYPLETLPALRQTLLKSGRTPCISEFEHE